ncbi:MAG: hypothetical protein ACTS8R_03230 [Arsenophonus sp. NC-QC1-MAG3]
MPKIGRSQKQHNIFQQLIATALSEAYKNIEELPPYFFLLQEKSHYPLVI